jgi:hypothetical protein
MSGQSVAGVVGASPGPAAHIALLGIVAVIALVILVSVRRRRKRAAAEAEMHETRHNHSTGSPRSTEEHDRTRSSHTE